MRKTPKPRFKIGDVLVSMPRAGKNYAQMKVSEAHRADTGLTWIYSDGKNEFVEWDVEYKL